MSADHEKISVEIARSFIVEQYLKLGGRGAFAAKHLNMTGHDFYTVEVSDRFINNELHLSFALRNGQDTRREVVLSLDQIFSQAVKIDRLLAEIQAERSADTLNYLRGMIGLVQLWASRSDAPEWLKTGAATNHRIVDALTYLADRKLTPEVPRG